ncbi:exopolysaccharide biosynthesis polyprenyl glycosylphosphotransferase [Stakelama saccharophila]|uniref:Exopolysaccharide biosynthesis polyprenyl glycosylphosphotransferase n=1 Tax=Stakelama saccharophila TaxID=3075605 RepID=A0ABZ0BBU9_9SPHN|nr:exopolysaccharide biosynthesis polyprenyl glycosylphosphotransferase [Stakelama sp. W311]WNO53784.1 exopolysaccharide biosynthesis polyprenyl glycosylphosphotransferase [Stakelama sp. W311]
MSTKTKKYPNVDPSLDSVDVGSIRRGIFFHFDANELLATLLLVVSTNLLSLESPLEAFSPGRSAGVSLLFSCGAIILSFAFLKRLRNYPGVGQLHYVLPVFLASYGTAIAAILILRLNYSIFVLILSLVMTVLAQGCFLLARDRLIPKVKYFIVEGGRTADIVLPSAIEVLRPDKPAIPEDPNVAIVADLHYDHSAQWLRVFAQAALRGVPVYHVTEVIETITGRVQIDHLSENHFGSLLVIGAYSAAKRIVDIIVAVVLLLLLAPLFFVVACSIRLQSKGPVFFRQMRVGFRGKIFEVIKFRTMYTQDASADDRATAMTSQDDDRITAVGHFLRRSRIDELPQLINVLRGEMSLIGPRPEALALSRWYLSEIPFYEYRHIVRPGITGWAQVNQGHVTDLTDVREKLHYDFFYIKNFSYWLDFLILIRTVNTIFTGFGAK